MRYLVDTDDDTLVVVGVETLDEVDADEDVETELEVDTLQKGNKTYLLPQIVLSEYTDVQVWKKTNFFCF